MPAAANFLVLASFLRLQLVGAGQAICNDHSCPPAHDELPYAADRDVMLLQSFLTTEQRHPSSLEDQIEELAEKLQPVVNRSGRGNLQAMFTKEALSQLLSEAGRQPASTTDATSGVWTRLINMSQQIVTTLIADTVDDQSAIDERRQTFIECENLPEQDTNLTTAEELARNIVTGMQQRQQVASTGSVSYDFGDTVSSTETESGAKRYLVERRMEQYILILSEVAAAQANHRTSQSALRQANAGLVSVKNSCRCNNKDAFDQLVTEVQERVGNRQSEEDIALLLKCMGEQPSLPQKMQCMSQNNWTSNLPTINDTEVELPPGSVCGNATHAPFPPDLWIERPLVANEGPNLGRISPLTSVDACKEACDNNPDCNSFRVCQQGPSGCWMKGTVVSASDTARQSRRLDNRGCKTWYKGCRTAKPGELCHEEVKWAMETGIYQNPEWYPDLTPDSSFEDFQALLHKIKERGVCPVPCITQAP